MAVWPDLRQVFSYFWGIAPRMAAFWASTGRHKAGYASWWSTCYYYYNNQFNKEKPHKENPSPSMQPVNAAYRLINGLHKCRYQTAIFTGDKNKTISNKEISVNSEPCVVGRVSDFGWSTWTTRPSCAAGRVLRHTWSRRTCRLDTDETPAQRIGKPRPDSQQQGTLYTGNTSYSSSSVPTLLLRNNSRTFSGLSRIMSFSRMLYTALVLLNLLYVVSSTANMFDQMHCTQKCIIHMHAAWKAKYFEIYCHFEEGLMSFSSGVGYWIFRGLRSLERT